MAENDLGEVVAQLVDDVAFLKQELLSQRWAKVAENFQQAADNFASLHERVKVLEDANSKSGRRNGAD